MQSLAAAFQKLKRRKPVYTGCGGWLDSALLRRAGIPTLIFRPCGAGAHASEEYVSLDSLIEGTQLLIQAILDFCGSS